MLSRPKARRMFQPEGTLYARRDVRFGDYLFSSGEEIPWREMEIDQPTVERWFRLRMVSHEQGGDLRVMKIDTAVISPPVEVVVPAELVTPVDLEEIQEDPIVEEPVAEEPVFVAPEKEKRKKR